MFDEYLNISYKSNLYMQSSIFSGADNHVPEVEYKDGYYFRNYHTISASTQLTMAYEEYSHVLHFGVSYNREGSDSKDGYYDELSDFCSDITNINDPKCEFYNISPITDEAKIDFIQYLYDDNSNEILYHRLSQNISYSTQDKYGELENELDYKIFSFLSFYNNMFYNYDQNLFSKVFNKINFHIPNFNLSVSHLYKDSFIQETDTIKSRYTSYITSGAAYTYNNHYSFSAAYNYDLEFKNLKSSEIGFMYKQRCWDFGIKYLENNRPILTQDGLESSIYDKYLYVTIVLKPIMKSNNSSFLTFKLPN
jgi:LPS-assembly protein